MGLLDVFRPRRLPSAVALAAAGRPGRSLLASAAIVAPAEGKRVVRNRRAWQQAALTYARTVPEVGYVQRYLGSNCAHIRLFVGDRERGSDAVVELDDHYGMVPGEDGAPETRDPAALPQDLVDAARDALNLLTGSSASGGGASILSPIVQNFEGPGECWLVGRYDPEVDTETWTVHSISEVHYNDNRYPGSDTLGPRGYYELVTAPGRSADRVALDPAYSTVVRMWVPDTEYSAEPTSPMVALVGVCEQLLLIDRANAGVLRSRAAGNGILLWPSELADPDDDEDDSGVQADLTTQLTAPLSQDGSAASVVPMFYEGQYQYLDRIRHLTLDRPMDPKLADQETRLLARLGVGLDVPPEIITGYADVNHWNVQQVSEDTFKNHQEPAVIRAVESLTAGYMRHRLHAAGRWDPALVDRVVIWHDPASLITPPDRREAANDAHDRGTISGAAHRRLLGLDESDAPEVIEGAPETPVGSTGMLAPQLLQVAQIAEVLLRSKYDPIAVTEALGLEIAHTGESPEPALTPPQELPGAAPAPEVEDAEEDDEDGEEAVTAALVAAAAPTAEQRRLSRRLMEIDRKLRERVAAAADAAMLRALERAGNRLRSRAAGDETARASIAGLPGEAVAAALGRPLVAALGVEDTELLADAFARLRTQYLDWTATAAEDAIDTAARLSGLDRNSDEVRRLVAELRDTFAEAAEASWPVLEDGLTQLANDRLYEPTPADPTPGELPDSIVPPGLVRAALALAGGLAPDHPGAAGPGHPLSGLTSGELLGRFMRDAGTTIVEYEWSYGISSRPFPPHAQLDGLVFVDFTDPALSTAAYPGSEWIGASFAPGDHRGCHCDYMPVWSDGGNARDEAQALGDQAYREQNPGRPLPTRRATVDGFAD